MRVPSTPKAYDGHWQGYVVAEDATHRYLWLWYGYNIRVIAVPKTSDGAWSYDHAWCYPRDPDLVEEALTTWDPDIQDEPTGWHKRPTTPTRRAPNRDQDPAYNRPRCEHGCYIADGCRTLNCRDVLAHLEGTRR
ncbi:hypothetical protein [Streptomyces omiyaensis]|uniref:hypothetical protein n=1 Tax=Streptomyces omiyaensis TaxID=68247 RepID=UPI0036F6BA48